MELERIKGKAEEACKRLQADIQNIKQQKVRQAGRQWQCWPVAGACSVSCCGYHLERLPWRMPARLQYPLLSHTLTHLAPGPLTTAAAGGPDQAGGEGVQGVCRVPAAARQGACAAAQAGPVRGGSLAWRRRACTCACAGTSGWVAATVQPGGDCAACADRAPSRPAWPGAPPRPALLQGQCCAAAQDGGPAPEAAGGAAAEDRGGGSGAQAAQGESCVGCHYPAGGPQLSCDTTALHAGAG